VSNGFAPRDVKLYTGKQILENYEVYVSRRTTTDKVVGSIVDDSEGRDLYLGYARQDRCAMWVRIPDEEDVPRAYESSRTATTFIPAITAPNRPTSRSECLTDPRESGLPRSLPRLTLLVDPA
jgi:hypothetical protein